MVIISSKRIALVTIGILCLWITVLVFFHHHIIHGYWYDLEDFLSHEIVETFFVGLGIGFLIASGLVDEDESS